MALLEYIENSHPDIKYARGIRTKLPIYYFISAGVFGVYSQNEYVTSAVLAAATFVQNTSYPLWTAPNDGSTWQISAVDCRYTAAAASAATFGVEVAATTVAPGSGTAQLSSLIPLNGTPNTQIAGVITTQTVIASGSSVNLVVSNAAATTSLTGLVITVTLQRLS